VRRDRRRQRARFVHRPARRARCRQGAGVRAQAADRGRVEPAGDRARSTRPRPRRDRGAKRRALRPTFPGRPADRSCPDRDGSRFPGKAAADPAPGAKCRTTLPTAAARSVVRYAGLLYAGTGLRAGVSTMKRYKVAIAGATGAVGREMMKVLDEREFPVSELVPLASERSEGQKLDWQNREVVVRRLKPDSFAGVDIALFSPGAAVSREFAPHAARAGAVVI